MVVCGGRRREVIVKLDDGRIVCDASPKEGRENVWWDSLETTEYRGVPDAFERCEEQADRRATMLYPVLVLVGIRGPEAQAIRAGGIDPANCASGS